jgi:hypothetical protein
MAQNGMADLDISSLINKLNSLVEGERAVADLLSCGQRAVTPLRQFLMEGQPGSIYQPRRWAVEALAGLNAKEALLEYLQQDRPLADEQVRLGEEAVRNAAAIALRRWPEEKVVEVLMDILRLHGLTGAIETLAYLQHRPAIPLFIAALEDDVCRLSAESALRKLGRTAVPELIKTVLNPRPDREQESPSSLLRRGSAARALADIGITREEWFNLKKLINETTPGILVAASRMAEQAGDKADLTLLSKKLLSAISRADWYTRNEIGDVLVEIYETAGPLIKQEVAERNRLFFENLTYDEVLFTLNQVTWRAEGKNKHPFPLNR